MPEMLDLGAATRRMAELVTAIDDDQLAAPTPCDISLAELLDHVSGLSQAFTAAATKDLGPMTSQPPSVDAGHLGEDWRTRIPAQLAELAEAWRDPAAWEGMTQAGGVDLPAGIAGRVALNEVVLHGWDVARASGQPFDCDRPALDASLAFVTESAEESQGKGTPGLFGPVVAVPPDAPLLDRVLGLSGRDPSWTAP